MELYGSYTSPFVRHCRIVLLETQLVCTLIETDATASAQQSPTKRVPFLQDGQNFFTDSSSIIKYLREKAGQPFLPSAKDFDEYCMINTALDATLNLFFLERDGIKVTDSPYLQRQAARIHSTLAELDKLSWPTQLPYTDSQLRLACYIGWALFRKRLDISPYKNLQNFYNAIHDYGYFIDTAPKS